MGALLRKTAWLGLVVITACSSSPATAPSSSSLASTAPAPATQPTTAAPTTTAVSSTTITTTTIGAIPELPPGVTVAGMIDFVETMRGRRFARTPQIRFVDETPQPEFQVGLQGLDWAYLQLLGVASEESRAAFTEFQVSQLEDGPFGKCCPVWVKPDQDPVQTAAIIVHELTHLIDNIPGVGGLFEPGAAIIEGNAVRIEAAFLASIGVDIDDVRRENEPAPAGVPQSLVDIIEFAYDEGFHFASSLAAELGESGIDEALDKRDMSTEHILFPGTYLAGHEIDEVKAPLTPEGTSLVRFGSIGAFVLQLVAAPSVGEEAASELVRLWAGDAYVMYRHGEDVCLLASVVFDTEDASDTLQRILEESLTPVSVEVDGVALSLETCLTS